jgi:tetratricopeptide (TPR) repeat protein
MRILGIFFVLTVWGCSPTSKVVKPGEQNISQARALTKAGKPEQAYAFFENLIKKQPDNLAAHRGLVEAAYYAGRLEDTADIYRQMTEKETQEGLGYYGLGLVEIGRGPGNMTPALKALEKAAELMPKEVEIPYRIGRVYMTNDQITEAEKYLKAAIKIDPDHTGVRVAYGHILSSLGRRSEALQVMSRILLLSPSVEEVKRARAITAKWYNPFQALDGEIAQELKSIMSYIDRDSIQQALSQAEKIISRQPKIAFAHVLFGLAHSRLENNGEAIVAFEKALELDAQTPLALVGLGDVYLRVEKWSKAREYYQKALGLDPFDIQARQRIGELAAERKDYEQAANVYEILSLLDPDNIGFRQEWATALVSAEKFTEALTVYESILQKDPDNTESLIKMSSLLISLAERQPKERQRYRDRARECLKKAEELNPDNQMIVQLIDKLEE